MAKAFWFRVELALLLYLPTTISAQNGTLPSQSEDNGLVGWQRNPTHRGTMNILESCILTIIACTWTIHHPNVPRQTPNTLLGNFLHHLKWMTLTVLLPEFILAQAVDEYLWVRKTWKDLPKPKTDFNSKDGLFDMTYEEKNDWSKKHLYYANMGGFRVNLLDDAEGRGRPADIFPLTSGELIKYLAITDPPHTSEHSQHSPAAEASPAEAPPAEAPISKTQIERMVKRDALIKTIAFLQISWIILSTLARWHLHRSTSQLEIMTVAFATCAVLTYILRWDKPQNIELWTEIPNSFKDLRPLYEPQRFFNIMIDQWRNKSQKTRLPYFRNDTLRPFHVDKAFLPWLILFMVLAGSLHLVAWNFSFPSGIEKNLWRSASLASTGIPLLLFICASLIPGAVVWIGDLLMSKKDKDRMAQDAKNFMTYCYWALHTFKDDISLDHPNEAHDHTRQAQELKQLDGEIDESIGRLVESIKVPGNYRDIFGALVLTEIATYVQQNSNRFVINTSEDFPLNLRKLYNILQIRGDIDQEILTTYDDNFDRTDVFPHKTAKWRRGRMSHEILAYTMPLVSVLYSVARLIIIAVAFSSLRAMPAGVYETTWSNYLPKLE
ncbi:hypothetical protein F4815DRAFT_442326 [Daldinia loculata]|nr:hypothetical protein F4815DRAFT_442326 [Daldinia loculata]